MNTDYMAALRFQLRCMEWLRTNRAQGLDSARYLQEVASATPTFVARWVAKAVDRAQIELPTNIVLIREDLPVRCGFASWDVGNVTPEEMHTGAEFLAAKRGMSSEAASRELMAMARMGFAIYWLDAFLPSNHLMLVYWFGHDRPIVDAFDFGVPFIMAEDEMEDVEDAARLYGRKLAYCLWAFMRERRVTTVTNRGVDRPLRKQAERAGWTHEPIVQVVELRAAEPRHAPSGEHETVDWSCRWAVRGHWHKYHYGDGTVRARWLAPYVKGPAGKALKSATKLLAVVR